MPILLDHANYKVMKWKNGRGETSEIVRFPETDPFLWRLSMAPVMENGPWSLFPGYDRYLTLVEGSGLKLNDKVINFGEVIKFSGDENISCDLIDGKIIDLNLIVRRSKVQVKYEVIQLSKESHSFSKKGKVVFIFCLSGELKISEFTLMEKNTLQIEEAVDQLITVVANKINSSFVLIDLDW